jgi:ketosteroid isomerase-like protein
VVRSNRALVDELLRRLNARDLRIEDLCHPDIRWRWPRATPGSEIFSGHDDVARGLDQWAESWEQLEMDPFEVIEDGDYVLVLLTYRMRGAGSGVYLEAPVAHLHLIDDGLLRRWWMFGDADKAKRRFVAGDRPAG